MQINVKIKRFDPEADRRPYWAEYTLEARGSDRVLDVINHLKWEVDGSLAFRRSCAHGICGSDAMLINGVNRLACKVLVKDLGERITIEPIRGLPVLKDLIVDMEPFFDAYKAVLPFFINDDPPPPAERHQSPEDRAIFDETTKCILCAACTTSCPVFWTNGRYLGPAAIVNAHRFIFDSRDQGAAERLGVLNQANGLWRCRTAYNCTEACPRDTPTAGASAADSGALVGGAPAPPPPRSAVQFGDAWRLRTAGRWWGTAGRWLGGALRHGVALRCGTAKRAPRRIVGLALEPDGQPRRRCAASNVRCRSHRSSRPLRRTSWTIARSTSR